MPRRILLLAGLALALLVAGVWAFVALRTRPVTAEQLAGEWVQDPDFVQNGGGDLDAQKREIDHWENYEFAFRGQRLSGFRLVFDESKRDDAGWAQPGQGAHFESDFTLGPGQKATLLKFTDQTKTAREGRLAWDGDKVRVTLGDREFRLRRGPAENLRLRKLIAAP
jgi:hypothetical protein